MKCIDARDFDDYWKQENKTEDDLNVDSKVRSILLDVQTRGDAAVRDYAERFDRSSPECLEVSSGQLNEALEKLRRKDPELVKSLEFAADNIRRFSQLQASQFTNFEHELQPGIFTGQRIVPVKSAAVYVPGGRFPLVSSVLMGAIPAQAAGVQNLVLASPPQDNGLPDLRILAAAALAGVSRVFAVGGAQAIAALAFGTESIPAVDVIVGPGNKYVAAAKRLLFGTVGIDFIAGPTDVLIIAGPDKEAVSDAASGAEGFSQRAAELAAADLLAQAEHDCDARARILLPSRKAADLVQDALERQIAQLDTKETARASLDAGGLMVIYDSKEEACRIADSIAPEHLELHLNDAEAWIPCLHNYGSLFIGRQAAEVLGDYSCGINHTLPTSRSARFTGGLSVRHFLKTLTTLRCTETAAWQQALEAAENIARAEGLAGHKAGATARRKHV